MMSKRAKFIGWVTLAVVTVATWRFVSPPAKESLAGIEAVPEPVKSVPTPEKTFNPVASSYPVPPSDATSPQRSLEARPFDAARVLTEQTLVGTKWERDGFGLEFGAGGKL